MVVRERHGREAVGGGEREGDRERRAGRGEDRGGRLEGGQVKVGSTTVL